ncbi:MAG: DUF421 domain-containing protein [Polaromonas sp.]|nr:DUF421 domain-containing protein [Polaromonas sp.]
MFDLQSSWWELPARAAVIYVALLVMVRFSGRRTVGQFTPFDLLVVMLLSESVSSSLNAGEESVTGGLLAAATLVALNIVIAYVTSHSEKMQHLVEGRAVLIGRNGEIFQDVLKRHRVPLSDVEQSLREADCDQGDMKYACLEADGQISILKEASSPPLPAKSLGQR